MNINQLMKDAFSGVVVTDNEIQFHSATPKGVITDPSLIIPNPDGSISYASSFTQEEILEIYKKFTTDLFNANIPNYRCVAMRHLGATRKNTPVIVDNPLYGDSVVRFGEALSDIIPMVLAGNKSPASFKLFDSPHEDERAAKNIFSGRVPNADENGYTDIGQLHFSPIKLMALRNADESDGVFSTRNLLPYAKNYRDETYLYEQGIVDKNTYTMKFLIPDVDISFIDITQNAHDLVIFYMLGTGTRSYEENIELFKVDTNVYPCRTTYDLSKYFNVRYPQGETTCLKINKNVNFDNKVLENILRNYANTF